MAEAVREGLATSHAQLSRSPSSTLLPAIQAAAVELPSKQSLTRHTVIRSHHAKEEKKRPRPSHALFLSEAPSAVVNPCKRRARHLNRDNGARHQVLVERGDGTVKRRNMLVNSTGACPKVGNVIDFVRYQKLWEGPALTEPGASATRTPRFASLMSEWLPHDGRLTRAGELSDRSTRSTCGTSRVPSLEAAEETLRMTDCPTTLTPGGYSVGDAQLSSGFSKTPAEGAVHATFETKSVKGGKEDRALHEGGPFISLESRPKATGSSFVNGTRADDRSAERAYTALVGLGLKDVKPDTDERPAVSAVKGAPTLDKCGCYDYNEAKLLELNTHCSHGNNQPNCAKTASDEKGISGAGARTEPLMDTAENKILQANFGQSTRGTLAETCTSETCSKLRHKDSAAVSADDGEQEEVNLGRWAWSTGVQADTAAVWKCLQEQLARRTSDSHTESEGSNKDRQISSSSVSSQHVGIVVRDCGGGSTVEAEGVLQMAYSTLADQAEQRDFPVSEPPLPPSALDAKIPTIGEHGGSEQASSIAPVGDDGPWHAAGAAYGRGCGGATPNNVPFYSVFEGSTNKSGVLRGHRSYPVVRGVSRDNTKRRWAVYWKGNRKYFYDKFYEDCYQAYLHAVNFRKHAKAYGPLTSSVAATTAGSGPGSPPAFLLSSSRVFGPTPDSAGQPFVVASCSSAVPPSTNAGQGSDFLSAAAEPRLTRQEGVSSSSSGALLQASSIDEALADLNRNVAVSRGPEHADSTSCDEPMSARGHGGNGTGKASGQTLELYKHAVRLMLQDLSSIVVPSFFSATSSYQPEDEGGVPRKSGASVSEGLHSATSVTLLQQVVQWHLQHVQKATQQHQVFQFLSILSPCLESTRLPSQSPPNLQQRLLLELLDLHVQQLITLSKDIYTHFQKQQQELFLLLHRVVSQK
ncbi:AP2 domain transcription factor AP2VIIa-8 [Besnoitia besnoiti]|uniref:AP2 domain transcription factor AP2VIIa-8 n=1 Tax=Besnoitia besnoiti TaxID=94643 RepID=A0A2A9M7C6_BESBE|nr:AP2 domain transcription factor AP2VIIa-8 [Besnoitia besnoiti]PFH31272.1 AP2 domain transcription factor AP2VIIa-8 [Besnoitia besnoiti]